MWRFSEIITNHFKDPLNNQDLRESHKLFFPRGSSGVSSQKRYSPESLGGARPSKGMVGSWKTTRSFQDGHFSGGII